MDGRVVALKFTSKADAKWIEEQNKQIKAEIEALRQIKHPHVMQLLAYNLNGKYPQKSGDKIPVILLVLEFMKGGELFDILFYTHELKEIVARTYFHQLIEGLEACHAGGICHRDIKPQNLLLDADYQLKIADFGLAKVFESQNELMNSFYVGTKGYQAPELIKQQPYTVACDIFSAGVVLFILLAGYPPFESADPRCRWYAPLAANNARRFWKQHKGCQIRAEARDLITRILWMEPDNRITLPGIKDHQWYKGNVLKKEELAQEVKELHKLVEIARKDDAEKMKSLQESNKRAVSKVATIDYHSNETKNIAVILRAVLMSRKLGKVVECGETLREHFWSDENPVLNTKNLLSNLIEKIQSEINAIDNENEINTIQNNKNTDIQQQQQQSPIQQTQTQKYDLSIVDLLAKAEDTILEISYSETKEEAEPFELC